MALLTDTPSTPLEAPPGFGSETAPLRIRVLFSPEMTGLDYLPGPEALANDLAPLSQPVRPLEDGPWVSLTHGFAPKDTDLLVMTAHGSAELPAFLAELRDAALFTGPIALWFWDNHIARANNQAAAAQADLLLPSHAFAAPLLTLGGPKSLSAHLGPHLPACSAQWSRAEAEALFAQAQAETGQRSDKLSAHYVDYGFAPRGQVLRALERSKACPLDLRLLDPDDRSPYFGRSRAERFQDWAEFKTSLCLPVTEDLSTRFFDALLAGQIPLCAPDIKDLDKVIPPELQQSLPVITIPTMTPEGVAEAHQEALRRFEADGAEGAARRHRYVLDHHMLFHRLDRLRTIVASRPALVSLIASGGQTA